MTGRPWALGLVASSIIWIGCTSSSERHSRDTLSYREGKIFPSGRFHPDNAAGDSFAVDIYSPTLRGMGEPRLDPGVVSTDVYRVTFLPSFSPSASVRLVQHPDGCLLVRKQGKPDQRSNDYRSGGFDSIFATRTTHADSLQLSKPECDTLSAVMNALRLEVPDTLPIRVGIDGTSFIYEILRDGRYYARWAWEPNSDSRYARFDSAGRAFLKAARYTGNARFEPR